jgi:catechol 2,3-dioxygenase-like lactoylglutathione lyase family enzyme
MVPPWCRARAGGTCPGSALTCAAMDTTDSQVTAVRPGLDAAGVVCSDLDRSVAFYRAVGLDVPDLDGSGHVGVDLAGGFRLMLDTEDVMRSFSARDTWSGGAGRVTLAMRCADPVDVDRRHDELAALGGGSLNPPFDAPWGQRYATVLDPDGTRIDLYADRPPTG